PAQHAPWPNRTDNDRGGPLNNRGTRDDRCDELGVESVVLPSLPGGHDRTAVTSVSPPAESLGFRLAQQQLLHLAHAVDRSPTSPSSSASPNVEAALSKLLELFHISPPVAVQPHALGPH
ncbi:unnamed protein product, partial [Pylaiella littoralis]